MNVRIKRICNNLILLICLFKINILIIFTEEHSISEGFKHVEITNAEKVLKQGIEVVESSYKFPTVNSLFEWLNISEKKVQKYKEKLSLSSSIIPQKEDVEVHSINLNSLSSIVTCLNSLGKLKYYYLLSLEESGSSCLFSDSLDASLDILIYENIDGYKKNILDSYLRLNSILYENTESSPLLLETIELLLEIYYLLWELFSVISGYKTFITQLLENTSKEMLEDKDLFSKLSSKSELLSIEKLEKNILERKLKDEERLILLLEMILSLFKGDFSISKKINELELLMIQENKKNIDDLERSLIAIKEANQKLSSESNQYSVNNSLLKIIQVEINRRKEYLTLQTIGSTFYCQKFDSQLDELSFKLGKGLDLKN